MITSDGGGATATVSLLENTVAVTDIDAADSEAPPQILSYAVVGGADAALFTIDSGTGALSFIAAPDFDAPTDVGATTSTT